MGEAGVPSGGRLFAYNLGSWRDPGLPEILRSAGWSLHFGLPKPGDRVAVWGRSPYAWRGEAVARRCNVGIVRYEDAFVRSIHPGRSRRVQPLGLLIDPIGVHFDMSTPSLLETLLNQPPTDPALYASAGDALARLIWLNASKYNDFDETLDVSDEGFVLVIDQTAGDASIRYGGADGATFATMLRKARAEHPDARILIKTHPETRAGLRRGHFGPADIDPRTTIIDTPISPWALLRRARAVYTVSSQMGYEAILVGHRPRVFGAPFYAGWGLSDDEIPLPRRHARPDRTQIFAVSHILAPNWYDPCRGRAMSFEEALDQIEADLRAFRQDRAGHVASGMRLWKRGPLQRFFGQEKPLRFVDPPAKAANVAHQTGQSLLIWGAKADLPDAIRVEDGFLRSRGLGAALVPPMSLIADGSGIYYDPTQASDLETLIGQPLPPAAHARTERLIAAIKAARLSKYNLARYDLAADLPKGHRILVPGQVEDDASIRLGAGEIATNLGLLVKVRAENPDAVVLYKPHPDVEAGLRPGAIPETEALRHADRILAHADPIDLIEVVDEIWTMTSLLGFEALLRGKPVTTTGAPFYAGWGLTRDLGRTPARRTARPDLVGLSYATLIAYPRYFDPISGRPCPPEVVVDRLASGKIPPPGSLNRVLSKGQGLLSGCAWFWR